MIYLASPYTHPDKEVMEQRFHEVCKIAGSLMMQGEVVFSPIAMAHPIAVRCELPRDWGFWKKFDHQFIANSDRLVVATMPGWEDSRGVAAEIAIANELGIPVSYLTIETEEKEN